jgi:hypothetical protein
MLNHNYLWYKPWVYISGAILLLLLASLLVMLPVQPERVLAQPAACNVSFQPSSVTTNTGSTFTLDMVLTISSDFKSLELTAAYDPALLDVSSISPGNIPNTTGIPDIHHDIGQAEYAVGITPGSGVSSIPAGTYTIGTLNFMANASTTSSGTQVTMPNFVVANPNNEPIQGCVAASPASVFIQPFTEITPTSTNTFTPIPPTATFTPIPPTATFTPVPPTATFTPVPLTVTPTPGAVIKTGIVALRSMVGYVDSRERLENYLGDPNLWTGKDTRPQTPRIVHGVLQFDLSTIPARAQIVSAQVELMGGSKQYLNSFGGSWWLMMLDSIVDADWTKLGYWHIHHASTIGPATPVLTDGDLKTGTANTFTLTEDQLTELQSRLTSTEKVSFRLDGDFTAPYGRHIFGWDAKTAPVLLLTYQP